MEKTFFERKRESKRSYGIFLTILIGVGILFAGEFLSLFVILGLEAVIPGTWADSLETMLFSFLGISILVILWARLVEKTPWAGLGISKGGLWKEYFMGWIIGCGMLVIAVFIMMTIGVVMLDGFHFTWKYLLRFLILLIAWAIQSGTEEILTRGYIFSSIAAKRSVVSGILVSSLFFTLMHLGNEGMGVIPILDLFLYGILTALYMLKTNRIWGVSGIHAAWNCFQGNVFGFHVSGNPAEEAFIKVTTHGPEWLSGGSFGVEGSIVSCIVQAVVIVWLLDKLKERKDITWRKEER